MPLDIDWTDEPNSAIRRKAIRAALIDSYYAERRADAMAAGNVNRDQLRLDFGD